MQMLSEGWMSNVLSKQLMMRTLATPALDGIAALGQHLPAHENIHETRTDRFGY
jgi:hypothetical protein